MGVSLTNTENLSIDNKFLATGLKSLPKVFQDIVLSGVGTNARAAGAKMGSAVAIDNNTVIIGVPGHQFNSSGAVALTDSGAAFVFERGDLGWQMISLLTSENAPGGRITGAKFGTAVDVNGAVMAVGSPYDTKDSSGGNTLTNAGAVYLYSKASGFWTFSQKITAPDRMAGDTFGASVAIYNDILIIGASLQDTDGNQNFTATDSGAIYVYVKSGNNYVFVNKLSSDYDKRHIGDQLGYAVAGDNGVLAVSTPWGDSNSNLQDTSVDSGAVHIWTWNIDTQAWVYDSKLALPSRGISDNAGMTLQLIGHQLFVGVPNINSIVSFTKNTSGVWTYSQTITPIISVPVGTFGSVMSFDGTDLIIGVPAQDTNGNLGSVEHYSLIGDVWTHNQSIYTPVDSITTGNFGTAVSVYDGMLIVGDAHETTDSQHSVDVKTDAGAAYVYSRGQDGFWTLIQKLSAWGQDRNAGDHFGSSLSYEMNTGVLVVGAPDHGYDSQGFNFINSSGAVYVFNWTGSALQFKQKVTPEAPFIRAPGDKFGTNIKIVGDRFVVGVPQYDYDNTGSSIMENSGAIVVFKNNGVKFVQERIITPSTRTTGDQFGATIDFQNDKMAVACSNTRKVWMYEYSTQWNETSTITPPPASEMDDGFASSVSFKDDLLLVGAPLHDGDASGTNPLTDSGAAFLYQKINGVWTYIQIFVGYGSDRQGGDLYGNATAGSGTTLAVSAIGHGYDGNNQNFLSNAGAVYIWVWNGSGWTFSQKVVPIARHSGDQFGYTLSMDGDVLAVSSIVCQTDSNEGSSLTNAGAVWIFRKQFGVWTETQKITPTGVNSRFANDQFGFSITLNTGTLVIGSPSHGWDEDGGNFLAGSGAAWIYDDVGSFSFRRKLVASQAGGRVAGMKFGQSVDIRNDYLLVGAPMDPNNEDASQQITNAGSAWLFTRANSVWTFSQKLVASANRQGGQHFGTSMSGDGNLLVVGAPSDPFNDISTAGYKVDAGAAYGYTWNGTSWMFTGKIVSPNRQVGEKFGQVVELYGTTLAIGVPQHSLDSNNVNPISSAGAVYLYTNISGKWTYVQKVVASDREANALFGSSISLDIGQMAVGSPFTSTDSSQQNPLGGAGAIYVFTLSGNWSQEAKLVATNRQSGDHLGSSLDLVGNVLVGGSATHSPDSTGESSTANAGAAFIWTRTAGVWVFVNKIVGQCIDRNTGDQFGYSVSVYNGILAVGAPTQDYDHKNEHYIVDAGAVYIYSWSLTKWAFVEKIIPTDRATGDQFGYAVSLWNNTLAVSAPYCDTDAQMLNPVSNAGSVYIFTRTAGKFIQQAKIVPTGTNARNADDLFGLVLDLNSTNLIVGSPYHAWDVDGLNQMSNAGAAWVFSYDESWTQVNKLIPSGTMARNPQDKFGSSVSISGGLLIVGAPGHSYDLDGLVQKNAAGAAWVFTQDGLGVWGSPQKIIAWGHAQNAGDAFGTAVAGDGTYLAVGAPNHSYDASMEVSGRYSNRNYLANAGAVFILSWNGSVWSLEQKITPTGTNARLAGGLFGRSLFMRGTILMIADVNHQYDDTGANPLQNAGTVWVFERTGSGFTPWQQTAKLIPTGTNARLAQDGFGTAMTTDGVSTIAVSAIRHPYDSLGANPIPNGGAVWVFRKTSGVWSQSKKITERYAVDYPYPIYDGLVSWWDANDTTLLRSSATAVASWHSRTTPEMKLSGSTVASMFSQNGKTVVSGNTPLIISDTTSGNTMSAMTIFMFTTGINATTLSLGTSSSDYQRLFLTGVDSNTVKISFSGTNSPSGPTITATKTGMNTSGSWKMLTITTDGTASDTTVYEGGDPASVVVSNATSTPLSIPLGGSIGATGTQSLGEILIYNRAVSTQERQKIEMYLAEKWVGLTITTAGTINTRPGA